MRRNLIYVLLFVITVSLYAQSNNELASILNKTYSNDPKLSSFYTEKDIADTKIALTGNLPDPKVTLGLSNMPVGSFSFTQEPMTAKTIALSQGIPFPGKLKLKEQIAGFDSRLLEPDIKEYKLVVKKKVELLYWNILQFRGKAELTNELIKLVSGVEGIVSTRYSLDQATKQQLVSIQLQKSLLEDNKELFTGNANSLLAELRVLAGEEGLTVNESIADFNFDKVTLPENIAGIIQNENPALIKHRLAIEKNKKRELLAEKDFYPDFSVTLQYNQRDKIASTGNELDDFLSVFVGFNIPINYGGKRDAAVEEKKLSEKLLREQINGISNNVLSVTMREAANLNTILNRINILQDGLLPQSEVYFNSTLSGVGTGVSDYISVIDALEKIISVKLRYIELKYEYLKGKTNLEYVLGTTLQGVNNE